MTQPADMVIHFPTSVVNIYIRNQHISASLQTVLANQYNSDNYWAYIETKFQWTTQTRKLIEWDIYHTTLKAQPTLQHKQLLKYISNWLPTGREMHRNDENEDHRCPHCHTIQETNQHILRCPHPERRVKREHFLRVTLNILYHKSNTTQPLRELISQNLLQWFQSPTRPHHVGRTHPLYHASIEQQRIGWQQFLRGHIAESLVNYQEQYYRERERPATETGEKWAKKMIQQVWAHFLDVWKLRCAKRHEIDKNRVSRQHTHKVQARTHAIYAVLHQLPGATRSSHYFDKELEAQLDQTTREIEIWLAHVEPLVKQGLAEAAQTMATGHGDIRDYFTTTAYAMAPN
jgi:hypothetical protein